jgi:predicted RND superfamily exporter protein
MIPSGDDYSMHDKSIGGVAIVLILVAIMLWSSGRRWTAVLLPVAALVVAIALNMSTGGMVTGKPL